MRIPGSVLAVMFVVGLFPVLSAQNTLNVPAQYKTIQAAIDAAQPKDTVLVAPGTYYENIDFKGKNIVVRSVAGPGATVIDGQRQGSVVSFTNQETSQATIEGFTITNGSGLPVPPISTNGGGIYCSRASPTIRGNWIEKNVATSGAGIFCAFCAPVIEKNRIRANTAARNGGGIWSGESSPRVTGNSIEKNVTSRDPGGGVHCSGGSPVIASNRISENQTASDVEGAGVFLWGNVFPVLSNNMIHGNSGGGGGILCKNSSPFVVNNTIAGNVGSAKPSGIACIEGSNAVIVNTILWGNAPASEISADSSSKLAVTYCDIQHAWLGTGNISADPTFVDPNQQDFHLKPGSPCINRGSNGVPYLPDRDFDGDLRVAYQTVDIGADEYVQVGDSLFLSGDPKPGEAIALHGVGAPNAPVLLGVSMVGKVVEPPVPIPGYGNFHLYWPFMVLPLGSIPPEGLITFRVTFPTNFPVPWDFPCQALIGQTLSNCVVVKVR